MNREDLAKEYNYYKVKGDMETCRCGHRALMHSWWVPSAEALIEQLSSDVKPELDSCDVNSCRCEKYKRDNLIYLENLNYE